MSVGFDSVLFDVFPDGDGYLPMPVAGEGNNPRTYTAEIRTTSGSDLATLRNSKKSVVTIVPAMGFVSGGTIVVEAGPGAKTLNYPSANAVELTASAILTEVAEQRGFLPSNEYRAVLTFVLVE